LDRGGGRGPRAESLITLIPCPRPLSSLIPSSFLSGGLSATTATTPSIVTIDGEESHGPVRPTLTRDVPHTARANKGVSHNSYGSHRIATLMSGAIPLTCHLRVIRVIRPVIRCK